MSGYFERIRTDSKSIALLAIFSAMVISLEVFPIVGITDLKFQPGGIPFTIDWTGIPIVMIYLGLGFVYSLVSILLMFIGIGFRNLTGAVFKTTAELSTILGLILARFIVNRRDMDLKYQVTMYLIFGMIFRALGMFIANILLLPIFYGLQIEFAIAVSQLLVPWNLLQALINVIGGFFLYQVIPNNLKQQAGLGEYKSVTGISELNEEEIENG